MGRKGEVDAEICPDCQPLLTQMHDELVGLRATIRSQASTIGRLKRELERDAHNHPQWSRAEDLFTVWRRVTGHVRSNFTPDRFNAIKPFLSQYGDAEIVKAIHGHAFDPYVSLRKNGTEKRHDGWDLLFRNADKFEEAACKAPFEAETLEEDLAAVRERV